MSRAKITVLLSFVVLLASLPMRADGPSAKEQALARENAELKAKIESLKAEIKALKEKPQTLELQTVPYLQFTPAPGQLLLTPAKESDGTPRGAIRKEFNGEALYLIPLANDPAAKIQK
jgi:hypothetical protein